MKHSFTSHRIVIALCSAALALMSCRKPETDPSRGSEPVGIIAPELMTNQMGRLPGPVYQSQARSPIRWQPWTRETLERARAARRLLFCVIAMPQHPGFNDVLDALSSDPEQVRKIHDHYVPVLIDGDASREMSILISDLCAEINQPVQLPLFLWLTHEANPVAWIPVSTGEPSAIIDLFQQSHTMVSQMWQDAPDYVINNSRADNENRRARIEQRKNIHVMSEQPAADLLRSLRQLTSLYDPVSRSIDETGGLFPTSVLELLAVASAHPGLPDDLRERCLATTRDLTHDLVSSAMFDPIDGGVFSSRRANSWALPQFVKHCAMQARVATALLEIYNATGDERARDKALGLIEFAEQKYRTADGLFAVGFMKPTLPDVWMWSLEDIQDALPPEDAGWWIKATGMKGLGNLPSELDPQREYFRANTLSMAVSRAEIADSLGLTLEEFTPRFEAARDRLLAVRDERIGRNHPPDDTPHAYPTLRMVSAYAAAFCATGDESYREKAVALLQRARDAFSDGPYLRVFATETPPSLGAGRNFLYALAMQAVLDVAAITSDESWLVWSEDLATIAAELFTGEDLLKECPDDAMLIDLPITDLMMLFDDSSAGLVSMAECRLAEIGRPLVTSFSKLATPLPVYTKDRPVLHTDLLLATLARHYSVTAIYGKDLAPEMKLAIERLPMRQVQRRPALAGEEVPAGSVKLRFGNNGHTLMVRTPDALRRAVTPPDAESADLPVTDDNLETPVSES